MKFSINKAEKAAIPLLAGLVLIAILIYISNPAEILKAHPQGKYLLHAVVHPSSRAICPLQRPLQFLAQSCGRRHDPDQAALKDPAAVGITVALIDSTIGPLYHTKHAKAKGPSYQAERKGKEENADQDGWEEDWIRPSSSSSL
jgi:hypothetical protein